MGCDRSLSASVSEGIQHPIDLFVSWAVFMEPDLSVLSVPDVYFERHVSARVRESQVARGYQLCFRFFTAWSLSPCNRAKHASWSSFSCLFSRAADLQSQRKPFE